MDDAKFLTIKIDNKTSSPPYNSLLISPPSSAFVSALQSPYISPRANTELTQSTTPESHSGSDDNPSTSYTPPQDKLKIVTCVPVTGPDNQPRISFSFPIPRFSVAKTSVSSSPASNSKLRSCDVYIGFHGKNPNLLRFCKWLKSELEVQGIACFIADRSKYSDNQSHEISDRVICSVTYGVVVITNTTLLNHLSLEEIRFFSQKKNLIPLFFDTNPDEIISLFNTDNKECKEALDGLITRFHDYKLEANEGNWRNCISKTVGILRGKLGRNSVTRKDVDLHHDELLFHRNKSFVGREKEIAEIDNAFFGREEKAKSGFSVVSITGAPGVGKTEVAMEFAYRRSQRYKRVLWVGGEGRYFRQNILNISLNIGLDVSADEEKERGRIRNFDEQESEAFKRVKREIFRDMPYLLIIDNLESEKEWWDGKDLNDLIPRNTGGTHVIITTRLSKVINFDSISLQTLPLSEAMALIRGRKKRDYSTSELDYLKKFDDKLSRSSFGLSVVGSLLSELQITPSALFEAVNGVECNEDETFLMKVLTFCSDILQESEASRMLQAGAWFAPAPIPVTLLAAAANNVPSTSKKKWTTRAARCVKLALGCCSIKTNDEESAHLLVRLNLALKVNTSQQGSWIQFHPITQSFARTALNALTAAKATVQGVRKSGNPLTHSDHLWASAFLVFGFKSEPPLVEMKAIDVVLFIKRTALPLAVRAFTVFSRCNSALELLKACTNVLEEVEKSFVSQIRDWCRRSLCWKKDERVDEYVWQEVTLLKATVLETRAKLLVRGGCFDSGEELCRTCISIRTVMLGHNHEKTLCAQETLAKLVRMRSKI